MNYQLCRTLAGVTSYLYFILLTQYIMLVHRFVVTVNRGKQYQ